MLFSLTLSHFALFPGCGEASQFFSEYKLGCLVLFMTISGENLMIASNKHLLASSSISLLIGGYSDDFEEVRDDLGNKSLYQRHLELNCEDHKFGK
jgi:hypothetical protein